MSTACTTGSADDGGSVLPLVALALVTIMIGAALTVDLGSLAATNRRLQGVADLAAIAGAAKLTGAACSSSPSVFDDVKAAAVTSATTNKFPIAVGGTKTLLVEVGTLAYRAGDTPGSQYFTSAFSSVTPGPCPAFVPTAVRVTAGDNTRFAFGQVIGQGGRTSQRSGTALNKVAARIGGFTIGSTLASLNAANSTVLDSVLNGMVCRGAAAPCNLSIASGYGGLASTGVTIGSLVTARGGVGTVNDLLTSDITASGFYLLTAKALGCVPAGPCSNAAAVTLLQMATLTATSTTNFKLGDLITVAPGSEAAALATSFNVLGLVTGSAQAIDKENLVTTRQTITLGGVSATLKVKVIEVPQTYIGPVGGSVSTSQVEITLSQNLNLNVPLLTLIPSLASVTGSLPVNFTAGAGTGTLSQVDCAPTPREIVSVYTAAATTTVGGPSPLSVKVAGVSLATVDVTASSTVGSSTVPLTFNYPSEFVPSGSSKPAGGTALNMGGTLTTTLTLLSAVPVPLNLSDLAGQITGALTSLATTTVSPVLKALGIHVGGADVWAIGGPPACPSPAPVLGGGVPG